MALEIALDHRLHCFRLDVRLVSTGGVLCLFGPSGSGKSLTLKALAGIFDPHAGRVHLDGEVLLDSAAGLVLPPQERRLGYVPQNYALFPHLTVRENIEFGLREPRSAGARAKLPEIVGLLRLGGLEDRLPSEISGGQQQRVALARALAIQPRMLLLDEPFSALDRLLVEDLRTDLRELQQRLSLRIVLVTHDLEDVRVLGDEVAFFEEGRVLEAGPVGQVLARPRTLSVARVVGGHNVNTLTVISRDGRLCIPLGGADIPVPPGAVVREGDYPVQIARGGVQLLADGEDPGGLPVLHGSLSRVVPGGDHIRLFVRVEGLERDLEAWAPSWWWHRHARPLGQALRLGVPAEAVHLLEAERS